MYTAINDKTVTEIVELTSRLSGTLDAIGSGRTRGVSGNDIDPFEEYAIRLSGRRDGSERHSVFARLCARLRGRLESAVLRLIVRHSCPLSDDQPDRRVQMGRHDSVRLAFEDGSEIFVAVLRFHRQQSRTDSK